LLGEGGRMLDRIREEDSGALIANQKDEVGVLADSGVRDVCECAGVLHSGFVITGLTQEGRQTGMIGHYPTAETGRNPPVILVACVDCHENLMRPKIVDG